MIKLSHIYKSYRIGTQRSVILKDINLQIADGELVALMGASGSGKTTAMNIMGLMDKPDSGQYYLNNKEVSGLSDDEAAALRNETIGFIFQSFFLLPRMNALQNVSLPLTYRHLPAAEIKERAMQSLEKVGLADRFNHLPNELSGGQQQRVAIARALVGDPHVLLADEPTGALDAKTSQRIMSLLIDINQREKTTVIIVTHDASVAQQCQRTIKVVDGEVLS
jgi:putative ABC transport system ATP-binding protein